MLLWTSCFSLASLERPGSLFKPGFLYRAAVQQQQERNSSPKQFSPTCLHIQWGSGMVANSLLQLPLLTHVLNSECCACKHACNCFLPEDVKVDQTRRGEVLCWCVHAIVLYAKHGRLCRAYYIDGREHNFNNATCLWHTRWGNCSTSSSEQTRGLQSV